MSGTSSPSAASPVSGMLVSPATVPPPVRGAAGGGAVGAASPTLLVGSPGGSAFRGRAGAARIAGPVDIVFVIDSHATMKLVWSQLPDLLKRVMENTLAHRDALHADVRWAVITYSSFERDYLPRQDELAATIVVDFEDIDTVYAALQGMRCEAGSVCKDVVSGLGKLLELSWREGSVRSTIVLLDGPPHGVVKLNPAVGTHQFFDAREDPFPDGSPTNWPLQHVLEYLQTNNLDICRQFVVWCEEKREDFQDLRVEFAKACHSLVIPQVPAANGKPPQNFFNWYLNDSDAVVQQLTAVVQELMVSSFMMRAVTSCREMRGAAESKDGTDPAPAEARAAAVEALSSLPHPERVMIRDRDGNLASLGSAEVLADLVARVVNQHTHSSIVSTRSKEAGVIPSNVVKLVDSSDDAEAKTDQPVKLGQGKFGTVYKGIYTERKNGKVASRTEVAIKAVKLTVDVATEMPFEADLVELRALLTMGRGGRKGLVRFIGWTRPSAATHAILNEQFGVPGIGKRWLLLVMRLYDGNLAEAVAARSLTDQQMISIAHDISCGLFYMHGDCRVMQDLKPENVLLGHEDKRDGKPPTLVAVIADLGMATRIFPGMVVGGTGGFIDPEVQRGRTKPSAATDMYSFGKVLEFLRNNMTAVPPVFTTLISRCLGTPAARPSAADVMTDLKRLVPRA